MKKTILLTIILSTLLLSNDVFDTSRINFGSIEYNAKTKMRIYNNGIPTFNLPIEISSHREAIQKNETGYLKKSTFKIKFTALKTDKMTFTTEIFKEFDKNKKLIKFTEKIDRNGETQTVVCVPSGACLIDGANKKEIGDKSDVVILECDNNTQKKMQCNVEKANKKGLANLTTKKNFIMENNKIKYNIEEVTKMTIDTEGNIKKISSKVKAKDLFSIKYTTKDIVQSP